MTTTDDNLSDKILQDFSDFATKATTSLEEQNQINPEFIEAFSDDSFWEKIKNFAKKAGKEVIEKALILYYVLQEENVPVWTKSVIVGALGYFISPIDAIPDIAPVIGFSDDFGVMVATLATIAKYVTDEIKAKAKAKLEEWFGA